MMMMVEDDRMMFQDVCVQIQFQVEVRKIIIEKERERKV